MRKFSQRLPTFYNVLFLVFVIAILFEESEIELVLFIGFCRCLTVFLRRPPIFYVADICTFILALVQNLLIFIQEQKFCFW